MVRELDVLVLLIEELHQNPRYSAAALNQVRTVVGHARDEARARLKATLSTGKLERLANRLRDFAKRSDTDGATALVVGAQREKRAWLWALDARLARRATDLLSAIDVANGLYVPERLHDVRIAIKKLRYVVELAGETGRRRITTDLAALKKAQDILGRLHDLEVLLVWGRDVQTSWSPPGLVAWKAVGDLVRAVEDDCRHWHARYLRDRHVLIAIAERLGAIEPQTVVRGRLATG